MKSWNHVHLEGSLGKPSEAFQTQKGGTITKFSMAVSNGKDVPPMWLVVKFFDNLPQLDKGTKVCVEGALYCEEWTAHDGTRRTTWGILADSVTTRELEF